MAGLVTIPVCRSGQFMCLAVCDRKLLKIYAILKFKEICDHICRIVLSVFLHRNCIGCYSYPAFSLCIIDFF